MSFVVKKRDLSDPAQLQALIVEHADDLERGLTVLDSRLLLGQATIDVVGLDADGALVLITVGLVADEEMFLKAVDAYSWCVEYPESVRRLYPTARISAAQPPRVMFVVERMPDAFHRKIKQLGFPEVDCVEFRHLDVDGTPAVYFDVIARLRRDGAATAPVVEQATPPAAPAAHGRSTSLKLQKLLGADRSPAGREPAPVVRMVHRSAPRPEPKPLASAPRTERPVAPKRNVDHSTSVRQSIVEASPVSSVSTGDAPATPIVRVTETPRLEEPVAAVIAPAPFVETVATAAVSEAIAAGPDLLAHGLEAAETMVEPFAIVERAAPNGHVAVLTTPEAEPSRVMAKPTLVIPESPRTTLEPAPLAWEPAELRLAEPEPACVAAEPTLVAAEPLVIPEPTLAIEELDRAIPEPSVEVESAIEEPRPIILEAEPTDVVHGATITELTPSPTPAVEALTIDEAPVLVASLAELEPLPATLSATELAPADPLQIADDVIAVAEPMVSDPEPVVAAPIMSDPEPVAAPIVAESESVVAALSLEPIAPVAPPRPTPSVFSRRPPEAVAARTEPKVSFAGVAKDLLAQPNRGSATAPPVSAPRASVEEITRGAIDDLVGATEKRTTDDPAAAFAKPSGAFAKAPTQKRPITIAPPPSDGQPIAGGPKLGTVAKRLGAPASATEPASATASDGESTQQIPQGFEGLQFPNDGVLTRQWMEFLNQMAAGK